MLLGSRCILLTFWLYMRGIDVWASVDVCRLRPQVTFSLSEVYLVLPTSVCTMYVSG